MLIKKRSFIPTVASVVFGMLLSFNTTAQFDLGSKISPFRKYITDSSTFLSISRSDIRLCYKLLYKKVRYEVTLTKDRRIAYVGTSDLNFVSPEGVKVKTTLGAIPMAIGTNATPEQVLADDRWWTRYLKLQSGWYVAFKSEGVITKDSQVLYFFKKQFE